ncbi:translocase of chloroplast 120, chloroplastic-like isoform X2 [Telopea speciosissima]|uniref:translocase of chloroplast 120, chloroplastic-like isoform X2 n=1 Tax=Telopea speciosissima TaxID=54955 RepID=UPI001CC52E6C|nr:translocase of chloroplast 120, chloroplastic-like isoform X2 [Telopea speciosissima]
MENGVAIDGKPHIGDTMAVEDGTSHPKVEDRSVHGFHESKDSEGDVYMEAPEEIRTQESPLKLGAEQIINGEVRVDKTGYSGSLGVNGISNGDHGTEIFEEAIEHPSNECNESIYEVGVADGPASMEDKAKEVVAVESNGLDDAGSVGIAEAVVNLGNDHTHEGEQRVTVEKMTEDLVSMKPVDEIKSAGETGNVEFNGNEVLLVQSNGFDGGTLVGNEVLVQSNELREFTDIVADRGIELSMNSRQAEGRNDAVPEKSKNGVLAKVSLGESPVVHEKADVNVEQVESDVIEPSQGNEPDELIVYQDSESVELKESSTKPNGDQRDHQSVQLKNSSSDRSLKESDVIEPSQGNEPDELIVHQNSENTELKEPLANQDGEHEDHQSVQLKNSSSEQDHTLEESDVIEPSQGNGPIELIVHQDGESAELKEPSANQDEEHQDHQSVQLKNSSSEQDCSLKESDVIEPSQGNEPDELIAHQDGESAEFKELSANQDGEHQDHQSVQLKNASFEQDRSLKESDVIEPSQGNEPIELIVHQDNESAEFKEPSENQDGEHQDHQIVQLKNSSSEQDPFLKVSDVIEPSQGNESVELIAHQDGESAELKEPLVNLDGEHQDHQSVQLKKSSSEQDPSLKAVGSLEVEIPLSAEESGTVKDDADEPKAKDLQDYRPLLADRNIREGSSSHTKVEKPAVQETQKVENRGPGIQSAQNIGSSAGNSTNPALALPPRPAGLGSAPLLGAAHRALQQPRANESIPQRQTQLVEDPMNGEAEENDDEAREKLQMIRVKFLRLAHRLGQTPHNVVVAQVLYRLGLAEQLQGGNTTRAGAFSFDRASAMAEQLEAAGQEPLDFSCTIMVIGKTGVGKSATVNSIFDEVKFSTNAFNMGTKKVQDVVGTVQGIKVRVIDTPGLLPSWSDQRHNEKVLHSVKRFIKNTPPDIVLYLDRLDMQSRDFGDMPLLRTITEIFGPSIWFNAIVVLTHAASAPPDGPTGTASSYETFVTQRSHMVQQAIRQAAGDMRLMNPVSLVENHSACRTNRAGQRVLPNGQVWKPHLLLLSFASKILAEANTLLKLQDSPPGKPFATRSRVPPLPFLLSSLLQSRPQLKLPEEQFGSDEDALDEDSDEASDSDEESEYDELPPFKRLTKAQLAKLSKAQRKAYFDELEYREKLFMKKQLKEERKRRKLLKKMAAFAKDLPNEYNESAEEESGGAASVPVPMPDLSLPSSFDSDNPTHRYRFLDSSNQWLVRPVLDTHGWDHDVGYEGINVERLFVIKEKIPLSFSGQVTKDKKEANIQMELASSVKHGEGKATSLGFDMQTLGKDMSYTLRSETSFSNFRHNKTAAGLSVTLLGDALSAGVKVEDKLIVNKRFRLVLTGGAMTGRGDVAYGGSLEATLRDKDYPLGRTLSTLGLSIMDWHGDLAIGCNVQSQLPLGRASNVIARANLNNRGAGQVSIRLNSSEQLQIALIGLIPLLRKLVGYSQLHFGQ